MTHIINLKGWLPDNGKKLFYVYCENFYLRTFKKKKRLGGTVIKPEHYDFFDRYFYFVGPALNNYQDSNIYFRSN